MNRKGFTLIELIAVVVILSIVLTLAVPSLISVYRKSQLKGEEDFVGRLSQVIDTYVPLNTGTINFNEHSFQALKEYPKIEGTGSDWTEVDVNEGSITIRDIITQSRLLAEEDFVNPGNDKVSCNLDAKVNIYRDSDYVYCHRIEIGALGCLTDEFMASEGHEKYAIDTCIWKEKE